MTSAKQATRSLGRFAREHSRLVGATIGAAAVGAATALRRRDRIERIALPQPGPLAAETAVSVHNAVKSAVIAAAHETGVSEEIVLAAVREAVQGGASAGADIAASVIGAVEGATEIAGLLDQSRRQIGAAAAFVAVDVASQQGDTAGARARDLLAPYLA